MPRAHTVEFEDLVLTGVYPRAKSHLSRVGQRPASGSGESGHTVPIVSSLTIALPVDHVPTTLSPVDPPRRADAEDPFEDPPI
jgi:hypothetical protein